MKKTSFLGNMISENLGVKAISLLLALIFFFWVRADQESTVTANVPLRLVLPSGTMIMGGNAPESVRVTVRGRDSDLSRFNRNQLEPIVLELNVLDHERPVKIPSGLIQTPSGVRVTSIVPAEVMVQIDNEASKLITIQPRIIGTPKAPFHLGNVSVDPKKIRLTGPKTLLASLEEVATEPIDVSGQSTTMKRRVRLRIDDPLLTYDPSSKITLNIPIDAQFGTRTIEALQVIEVNSKNRMIVEPDEVQLELLGPTSLLDKVNPDAIHVVVDLAGIKLAEGETKKIRPHVKNLPKGLTVKLIQPNWVKIRPVQKVLEPIEEK